MKRSRITTPKVVMIMSVTLVSTGFVSAQTHTSAPPTPNVVTLAFNAAILQTKEAQRDLGALQIKFAPRQTQLQKLNNEIEELRRQVNNTSAPLNDAERNSKEQAINSKVRLLEREAEDFKSESETASQQAFQRVAQKMYTFVQRYAQQHAYSLILERGSNATPVVWYAANNIDITDEVIKAYDLNSGDGLPETPRNTYGSQHPNPSTVSP